MIELKTVLLLSVCSPLYEHMLITCVQDFNNLAGATRTSRWSKASSRATRTAKKPPRRRLEPRRSHWRRQGLHPWPPSNYVALIDRGIAVSSTYGVYAHGMAKDVFIKYEGKPYLAQAWLGPVYFLDFLGPNGGWRDCPVPRANPCGWPLDRHGRGIQLPHREMPDTYRGKFSRRIYLHSNCSRICKRE